MVISEMNVKLTASTSSFARAMDRAERKTRSFRSAVGAVGRGLRTMAVGAGKAALALAAIAWPLKKAFDLGSSIAETSSKFDTVFGPSAERATEFLEGFANVAGLTMNEAKGLVSTTGAIAQGLGFTQQASADVAVEITKLAGDLSSFNNIPTEETLLAINSALTGEREQLKRLGIVILEADVQKRALAMTGKDVAATLTTEDKAMASLALITEKAGVAVGDLERTSSSAANVFRRLASRFKEIRDAFTTALMPMFAKILEDLEANEQKFLDFRDKIIENTAVISAWGTVFIEVLKLVAQAMLAPFRMLLDYKRVFIEMMEVATSIASRDVFAIWGSMSALMNTMGENLAPLGEQFGDVWESIQIAMEGGAAAAAELQTTMNNMIPPTERVGEEAEEVEDSMKKLLGVVHDLESRLMDMSARFSSDFVNRMTEAVNGAQDAFAGWFSYMKQQITELALRYLMFKAITGMGGSGDWVHQLTGFTATAAASGHTGPLPIPNIPGPPRPTVPIVRHPVVGMGGGVKPGMSVNQTINFQVSAIDGQSASKFIRDQGGAIAQVVAEASKDSLAFRRQLQGA